ncbi:hypothetical protein HOF65_06780 [bacterium]|jgi:DNA helicase-2/ATP-dependent DNA helicase PcrA|nr:hypothetical protein [bacterium]MBT5491186.1 hypothetical protein [bacterium]
MLDFYNKYPETKFIVLENNYRSTQSILDFSTKLIENNNERLVNRLDFLDKKLIAHTEYKDLDNNNYYILANEQTEKIFILNQIKNKKYKENINESFAIIVRSNREVEEWTNFMQSE